MTMGGTLQSMVNRTADEPVTLMTKMGMTMMMMMMMMMPTMIMIMLLMRR